MKTYVQQIMLGTVTASKAQARNTLGRIKSAGYDGIELNRFMIHPSSLAVRMLTRAAGMPTGKGGKLDWHALLGETGLGVVSLHTDLGSQERESYYVIEEAKSYGTDKIVITGMYRFDYGDITAVRSLADRLNKAGETVFSAGMSLLYHNHNAELLRIEDGRFAYEAIMDDTDPRYVGFEFDSYWFTDAGADVKYWMSRLGDRMKLWHITDRGSRRGSRAMTPILKADSTEIGTGNMDLDGLWSIAAQNGVQSVVLESHGNWTDNDPVKSIELSAQWLGARK